MSASNTPKDQQEDSKLNACQALSDYVSDFSGALCGTEFSYLDGRGLICEQAIPVLLRMLHTVRQKNASVYIIGNGGSSAVASHIANDFCNTSRLRAITLHDPALLTCFANDYGYDKAYAMLIERMAKPEDLLVAISSSGQSQNMLGAVAAMREVGGQVMTLSGFREDNPLRSVGDMNAWVSSTAYGVVEIGHLLLLHYLADQLGQIFQEK